MFRSSLKRLDEYIVNLKPEVLFGAIAATFGLLFIIITPPLQTPDEVIHFYRSYQASTPNLKLDDSKVLIPKSIGETVELTSKTPIIRFDASKKYDGHKTIKALSIKLDENNLEKLNSYNLALGSTYGPFSYLPQSIGILLGRILDASPVVLIYLGRLMNLLTWILLFVLSIKLIPRKKWAVVFIGLIPMGLFQAISLGADSLAIGLGALFVSTILYLREKTSIHHRDILVLLLIASVMVLTKQNMLIFIPLILLIKSGGFKNIKVGRLAKAILILVPLFLTFFWSISANPGSGQAIEQAINGQNSSAQMQFIVKNPQSFINVLWNTNFFIWGDVATGSLIGNFGWADTPLSEVIVVIGYIGLFLVLVANTPKRRIKWLSSIEKILIVTVLTAFWFVVSLALYIYYSPVGYKIIVGLQGRYFLPLLILLIPLLYSNWLKISELSYRRVTVYAPIFLLLCSFITIYVRFYVNNV